MNNNVAPYQLDAAALSQQMGGSKTFGPLTLTYNIDLSIPQISGSVTLFGTSLGSLLINPQHPSAKVGGNIGFATAEATITANFTSKELDYDIDVEAFGQPLYKGSGKLFSWGMLNMAVPAIAPAVSPDEVKKLFADAGITNIDELASYAAQLTSGNSPKPALSLSKSPASPYMLIWTLK